MKMRAYTFLTAVVLCSTAAVAWSAAQERDGAQAWRALKQRFDTDLDGKISRAEYPRSAAVFRRLDRDRDGFIGEADFLAARGGSEPSEPAKPASDASDDMTSDQLAFFESKVRPLLANNCYSCHSPEAGKVKGGIRVDSRASLLEGGPSGPALVPGDVEASLLVKVVRWEDEDLSMPPKKKLSDAEIGVLEDWVRMGAPWPKSAGAAESAGEVEGSEVESYDIEYDYEALRRDHWAFRPVEPVEPPSIAGNTWSQEPIDRFLLEAMQARGVAPVADATKSTWLRRVTLDLTGLPPTPAELAAFEADRSPDAHAKVVDRLLASPAFGERWGRHWLDVARYAESSGKERNVAYPHAWRYRDWVVSAFNDDMAYDRFLAMQVAGDLLPAEDADQRAAQLVATGYLAVGSKSHNARDKRQFMLDVADEQIDALSQGMLGLTISCARCHDHKFDPIPIEDYYSFAGIFVSTETRYGTQRSQGNDHPSELVALPADAHLPDGPTMPATVRVAIERVRGVTERQAERAAEENMQARTGVDARPDAVNRVRQRALEQQGKLLDELLSRYDADGRSNEKNRVAMGVAEGKPRDIAVLKRGELDKPGEVVQRGFLTVLEPYGEPAIGAGSGRLELARWIASESNPLTARVWANRVWSHLFGDGIVPTVDNFGLAGQPPEHPELLDWLAATLVDEGWSTKKLVRRIVLSRAYRLASQDDPRHLARDPEVVALWRFPERRLEAEAIRDSMLFAAGLLQTTPPVGSNAAFLEGVLRNEQVLELVADRRPVRSLYLPILRDHLPESLAVFDMADPSFVVGRREETNVATQALFLMNDPTVVEASDALAKSLLQAAGDDAGRIESAFLRALGRKPTSSEQQAVQRFLADFDAAADTRSGPPARRLPRERLGAPTPPDARTQAWSAFVQTLFQGAEFRFLG
jgi:mono/diheme cytochrome c family protein